MDYTDVQDLLRSLVARLELASQQAGPGKREAALRLRRECADELGRLHTYGDEQLAAVAAKYRALAAQLAE